MSNVDSDLAQQVAHAVADLVARLSAPESAIEVVRAERVTWPDSSLGCPRPGMSYKQVLVPGVFIQLNVGQQTYHYHSGKSRQPFLCQSPDEMLPEDLPDTSAGYGNV